MTTLEGKTLLIGIGAQKAGTTWLHHQLQRCPSIYMSSPKELHHFDSLYESDKQKGRRFARERLQRLKCLVARIDASPLPSEVEHIADAVSLFDLTVSSGSYLEFFRRKISEHHDIFGEFSPSYSVLDIKGLTAIKDCHDKVRLIFLMRDPVARLVSVATWRASKEGRITVLSDVAKCLDNLFDSRRGQYNEILANLDQVFEQHELFVNFYENISTDEFQTSLNHFLGVDEVVLRPDEKLNVSEGLMHIRKQDMVDVRSRLSEVYSYCERRFGSSLPASWWIH